ncbi:KAP family P-loop NTPase fold protein [Stutzerimonas nitrititolerans]|uniref:KAP family P-loop NTPase fold protein n=1 Tax=Stutzerimonas nitrititolerans TaxID=2482751 RepID=UPI0028B1FBDD|nr:P-loop NTPase fold protein [Stutzerimonas nitrititolerans]
MTEERSVWLDDAMDRKKSSDFLTSYLLSNPHIKVLNVNSPWGSGKSFFLERWASELSAEHVCIFFNAWDTDYTDEPLVALITSIEEQTTERSAVATAGKAAIQKGTELIKKATPLIIKGLVKKYVGVELEEVLSDTAGDTAEGIVEHLISEQSKTSQHISDFKKAVAQRITEAASRESKKSPAFIFIDELDRCRPTYAIELLERIKHFFELDDCRFVIASDTSQLAHSIRAVYGDRFHSERYLSRFFDAEFRLDNRDLFGIIHANMFSGNFSRMGMLINGHANGYRRSYPEFAPADQSTITCSIANFSEASLITVALTHYFKLELRETLRGIKQLKGLYDASQNHTFNFFWAAFLVFSKMADETLYNLITSPTDTIEQTRSQLATYARIKFAYPDTIVGVDQLALTYLQYLSLTHEQLYEFDEDTLPIWQKRILLILQNEYYNISNYRKVVELAHRLS